MSDKPEVQYVKLPVFQFCKNCAKILGTCNHTKSNTFKRVFMSKKELVELQRRTK